MILGRREFALALAQAMHRLASESLWVTSSRDGFQVDIGGYTVTTITVSADRIDVRHDLHRANWDAPNTDAHIVRTKRIFAQALDEVTRRYLTIVETSDESLSPTMASTRKEG